MQECSAIACGRQSNRIAVAVGGVCKCGEYKTVLVLSAPQFKRLCVHESRAVYCSYQTHVFRSGAKELNSKWLIGETHFSGSRELNKSWAEPI